MVVKTKWVTMDVDKLDTIFNVMDKINTAAVRGLIDQEGKDLLLTQLRQEIPHVIIAQESKPEPKPGPAPAQPEKAEEPEAKPAKKK